MNKIFILHGWTYSTESWQPIADELRSRGADVELPAIPGLTEGSNPVWTLDDYVEWLKGNIQGDRPVTLIGHSNGGRISLAFAAKYPHSVAKLILLDSSGIPARGLRSLKNNVFRLVAKAGGALVASERFRDLLYKLARVGDYRKATPEMRRTMVNLLSVDLSQVLHKIQCPTLIVWGADDTTTLLSDGERIHQGIRGSRMIVIPGARHSPHITHRDRITDILTHELNLQ